MKIEREHYVLKKHPHDNVVSYLGRIDDKGMKMTYFVMELCHTDLKTLSKDRRFSEAEIAVIMKEVLTALDHLHSNKVLHRLVMTFSKIF